MASDRVVERRRVFQQYKEDVKDRGKPFYPYAMFHDTVMSLVVVSVIIGLAVIWRYTSLLGKLYDAPADPGTINFVPRPDWYFYFLFYLLRVFKWPPTVILGTIGIPTICLVLLISLPFYDIRPERHPLRRPVAMVAGVLVIISMGVLTYKGATAREALGSELKALVPTWAKKQGFENNPKAIAGANLFAVVGMRELPSVRGDRRWLRGCAEPQRRRREGQGRRLPDQAPRVPVLRQSGVTDAVLPGSRHRTAVRARSVPGGLEGRQVAALPRLAA